MSYTAISVRGLSKRYRIGTHQANYKTLGESIAKVFPTSLVRRLTSGRSSETESFWALNDLSFDVKQGEVVGVIGHNGAGKSTLLKILSRITEPTDGTADIYGRVGSLLEVGTGFHMELTGRENTYLSGAILGMKKQEIDRRFDEIVAFAEVDRFIDTPVKHYSSGMHLRLAFAVAAHLEPEILLVDEVLAVGDMAFQKKCLNKMEDVAQQGRTVLFVSHNMGAIKELCHTALVLKNGRNDFFGPVVSAIQHYSHGLLRGDQDDLNGNASSGWSRTRVAGDSVDGCRINNTEPIEVRTELRLRRRLNGVVMHCFIEDAECTQVVHNYIKAKDAYGAALDEGTYRIQTELPPMWLKPGVYTLYLKLIGETEDAKHVKYTSERVVLDITDRTDLYAGKVFATILPPAKWGIESVTEFRGPVALESSVELAAN